MKDQCSCVCARTSTSYNQKYSTFLNCSDIGGCSFTFYTAKFDVSFLNVFDIHSEGVNALLLFGKGSIADFSNCVFKHNGHLSVVSYYDKYGSEKITFLNCLFDSPYNSLNSDCITQNVNFI